MHHDDGTQLAATHDPFGFDLPEDDWLSRVRRAAAQADLGRLGDYVLLGEIGRGAQGVVYKAIQPRTRRTVALKLLAAGSLATRSMRARFEREVEAACLLSHPGIVTVHGVEIVDGQPVLEMEWVEGEPIDRWSATRPLREVLGVFVHACEAVAHAHRRGVLHRDLKPSNVLVDRHGRARVLDFGLAKPLSAEESGTRSDERGWSAATVTHAGGFLGTPAYAPPEALAEPPALDTRSDVYALGVILYRLIAGQAPFDASRGVADLFDQIRRGGVRSPSTHRAGISPELDAITLRAMALEPERRYASPGDLAADVRRYLAGEAVTAHPPGRGYIIRKFIGRHRLGVSLAGTGLMLILLFAAAAGVLAFDLARQRERLHDALDREHAALIEARQASLAEGVARRAAERSAAEATAALARAGRQSARHHAASEALERLLIDGGLDALPSDPAPAGTTGRQLQNARVRRELTRSLQRAGLHEEALEQSGEALRLVISAEGAEGPTHAAALSLRAESLAALGRLEEAERDLREALRIREKIAAEGTVTSLGLADLGAVVLRQGRPAEAEAIFRRAIEIRTETARPGFSPAPLRRDLGLALLEQGRFDEAEVETRAALDVLSAMRGSGSEPALRARGNLIRILEATGRLEEAQYHARKILEGAAGPDA